MVSTGTIRAVHPQMLAHVSGVSRQAFAASPVPPVIRPNLLTTQLMGCCPHCDGPQAGPVGLTGYIPPDYGTLHPTLHGLGKADTGTNAATSPTRSWSFGLRGLGKADTGTNAATSPTRSWSFGLRGLGQDFSVDTGNISVSGTIDSGGLTIPGVGSVDPSTAAQVNNQAAQTKVFLGGGHTEANIIVPTQNNLMAQLGVITNQILTGMSPTVAQLQGFYTQVWILGVTFQEFVLQRAFIDRRASGQALNTVMPFLDGTCGYAVPLGLTATPTKSACGSWGDGTIGGIGVNGMLGAIGRAITQAGGIVPALMDMHQAANHGLPPQTAATLSPTTGATATSTTTTGGLTYVNTGSVMTSTLGGIPVIFLIGAGLLLFMGSRR